VKPAEWRAAVLRSPTIDGETRCVLLVLDVTDDGRTAVSRAALAAMFGRSERQIAERLRRAREAGFLAMAERPARGRPTIYEVTAPSRPNGRERSHMVERVKRGRTRSRLHPLPATGEDMASPDNQDGPDTVDSNACGHDFTRPISTPGETVTKPDPAHTHPSLPLLNHGANADAAHDRSADVLAFKGDHQRRTIMNADEPAGIRCGECGYLLPLTVNGTRLDRCPHCLAAPTRPPP
jgi:hypothetical protein